MNYSHEAIRFETVKLIFIHKLLRVYRISIGPKLLDVVLIGSFHNSYTPPAPLIFKRVIIVKRVEFVCPHFVSLVPIHLQYCPELSILHFQTILI
jgi:hypothetical protein